MNLLFHLLAWIFRIGQFILLFFLCSIIIYLLAGILVWVR